MIFKTYGPKPQGAVEDALSIVYCAREGYEGAQGSLAAAIEMLRRVPTDSAKKLADQLDDLLAEMPRWPSITEEQREQAISDARAA